VAIPRGSFTLARNDDGVLPKMVEATVLAAGEV
jgi:hypothetical protein